MLYRLLNPRLNDRTISMGRIMLLIVLLAAGYVIGSTLNTQFQPNAVPVTADSAKSGGAAFVEPPHLVKNFTLTSQTGQPISLSDLHGRAVLMFFGYTHCPDVCPTTLADYTRVKQALGSNADEVAFVFISVDGKRDTPDVLTQYLGQFDAGFIGMTGDETTLRRLGAEYGLLFQHESSNLADGHEAEHEHQEGQDLDIENYFVQHTSPSFLVDRDGYLRLVYFYGTEPSVIAEGIRQVLGSEQG